MGRQLRDLFALVRGWACSYGVMCFAGRTEEQKIEHERKTKNENDTILHRIPLEQQAPKKSSCVGSLRNA